MLTRLTLTNFLAHARSEIVFSPRMTVLTGPNNSGKSAVVEALRCLATNPTPRHFIRHGQKEARVEAEFDDGSRVAWVRRPASAIYEVYRPGVEEPVVYAKFGRTPPEDVLDILRLNLVPLEGGKDPIDVHLGNQREPVFLINRPGSEIASFFASSSESSHLLAMQHLLQDRMRKAKQEEKGLASRLSEVADSLDRLSALPGLTLGLEGARALLDRVQEASRAVPGLESLLTKMHNLSGRIRRAESGSSVLEQIQTPPAPWPVRPLAVLLGELHRQGRAESLTGRRQAALAPLAEPPALAPVSFLAELAARSRTVLRTGLRLKARSLVLAKLTPPPPISETKPLKELLASMRLLADRQARAAADLAAVEGRLASLAVTIEKRLEEIGTCPLCGGELTVQTFLEGGHRHG